MSGSFALDGLHRSSSEISREPWLFEEQGKDNDLGRSCALAVCRVHRTNLSLSPAAVARDSTKPNVQLSRSRSFR